MWYCFIQRQPQFLQPVCTKSGHVKKEKSRFHWFYKIPCWWLMRSLLVFFPMNTSRISATWCCSSLRLTPWEERRCPSTPKLWTLQLPKWQRVPYSLHSQAQQSYSTICLDPHIQNFSWKWVPSFSCYPISPESQTWAYRARPETYIRKPIFDSSLSDRASSVFGRGCLCKSAYRYKFTRHIWTTVKAKTKTIYLPYISFEG